jgi:sulfite reductase alpha subunit-like flavoprotein
MDEEKIKEVLTNYKNKSNKDLTSGMDFLAEDFENTKGLIIKLTHHLDATEKAYNKLFDEFQNRTKQ